MDKRVIFAVAGSGKTQLIIDSLDLKIRSLLITYTDNNYVNLKLRIIRRFGYIPSNIYIYTYFSFMYSFCIKPYFSDDFRIVGINYKPNPNRYAKGNDRYIDNYNRLYSNRIAKFLDIKSALPLIRGRLERYFDILCVDEVQDMGGYDFNFLMALSEANITQLYLGDFYQHTFDTSNDGVVNANLHSDYELYKSRFVQSNFTVDTTTLNKSYRCSITVCDFVTRKLRINIESHKSEPAIVKSINSLDEARSVITDDSIIKLFYREHNKYRCYSSNWGESKGIDKYNDVCVVLNKTTNDLYIKDEMYNLKPTTKNKFYVACTRARRNLYLISETFLAEYKVS
ncbi:RNA helicase [Bacteroides luti]|uniref:RNA helicase n=1 Tax=Bacteroides luti TaxID=1297750 RepID=A0A1M5GYW4_9BACE|nr:DNA helicase UvrD [Bacteroides luti]SHG08848.1 RNA helicase [Bacteroides luti]